MGQIILRLDRVMADRKMSLNELSARTRSRRAIPTRSRSTTRRSPRFSTLAAICDVLNCQPGDILEYKPDEE